MSRMCCHGKKMSQYDPGFWPFWGFTLRFVRITVESICHGLKDTHKDIRVGSRRSQRRNWLARPRWLGWRENTPVAWIKPTHTQHYVSYLYVLVALRFSQRMSYLSLQLATSLPGAVASTAKADQRSSCILCQRPIQSKKASEMLGLTTK